MKATGMPGESKNCSPGSPSRRLTLTTYWLDHVTRLHGAVKEAGISCILSRKGRHIERKMGRMATEWVTWQCVPHSPLTSVRGDAKSSPFIPC